MIVKICGVHTLDEALAALDTGADMLGFNFYEPSPRYIAPAACTRLVAHLRQRGAALTFVGVFVNHLPAQVAAILDECGLDLAQLHGDEPPADLGALAPRAFKAVRPRDLDDARALTATYALPDPPNGAPALLVDAAAGGAYGGSGQVANWELAAALAGETRLLLAGGLRPDNVAAAVAAVQPWGVDVASGVESAPGVKDPAKMAGFIAQAKGY
jgi:phosphoribosylanthranilate isomerase